MNRVFSIFVALLTFIAEATPTIANVTARQIQSWNGLVEIAVGLSCEPNDLSALAFSFAATNSATMAAIPVEHITRNGDDTGSGTSWTRKFIWDAEADVGEVKIDDLALTVGVCKPSGIQLWEDGPYWAECNVGATKPEEYGYYFCWGDTVAYKLNASKNGWVSVEDGRDYSSGGVDCPAFGKSCSELESAGYIDSTGNLVAKYDAATEYLGAQWRMPNDAEFSDLISKCATTWTESNGVYGLLVKGKGVFESNSIFLPAGGPGDPNRGGPGTCGDYWSSAPHPSESSCSWCLSFASFHVDRGFFSRYFVQSVRPVRKLDGAGAADDAASTHLSIDCTYATQIELIGVTALQKGASNGLVDIAVTMHGSSNDVANAVCLFFATNSETKAAIPVEHITRNGEDEVSGTTWTRKFIWDAKADVGTVKIDDVALIVDLKPLGGVQLWENGPYWAECNVGATKPEEYGYYFWWGDTVGYKREGNNWNAVDGSKEGFSFSSGNCPTHNKSNSELQSAGYIDARGKLVAAHDAAAAHLRGPWRMPMDAEFSALINNCDAEWTSRNGVFGRLVKGRGEYASRSIFLPAAGTGCDSGIYNLGSYGSYWSSTPYSGDLIPAWHLNFSSDAFRRDNYYYNYFGQSVRPVHEFSNSGKAAGSVVTHLALDFSSGGVLLVTGISAECSLKGFVDITVTFQGLEMDVSDAECLFIATNNETKAAILISHITQNGDVTGSGTSWTRKFIWDAKADVGEVKIDDVELTVGIANQQGGVQLWENGPYWARCNVGATKPEDGGYYFWWGDTVGYKRNASSNGWVSVRDGSSFSFSSENCLTHWMSSSSDLQSDGYIDATGNLVAAHDAATAHLGTPWRMPTDSEFSDLISKCDTEWTVRNGVPGRLVKGRGTYAAKNIFLPAVGSGIYTELCDFGELAYYWSSTPFPGYSSNSRFLSFYSGEFKMDYACRDYGRSVRPVRETASTFIDSATTHLSIDYTHVVQIELIGVTALQQNASSGLVDIVVTMSGASNDVAEAVCLFSATNGATKAAIPFAHITQNGDVAGEGAIWTRKFVWDAKADVGAVKIDDLVLTVNLKPLSGVQLWKNGPYWAECNVGATKPEECGYYFWWGDTVGYKRNESDDGWISVKDSTSFSFSTVNCLTSSKSYSQLRSDGYIDTTGNLVAAHDAATAHLGAPWRMPTDAEFSALINNCDTEWTSRNGVSGRLVKGRGAYASKSIFLPAVGRGDYSNLDSNLGRVGSYGGYWSSSTDSDDSSYDAWYLSFNPSAFVRNYIFGYYYYGQSVRPVRGFAGQTIMATGGVTTHLSVDNRIVTGVTAQQRFPRDGLVDVTVTIQGKSNDVVATECMFAATNSATGEAIAVEHITCNGDGVGSGNTWTLKFIWDAKADVGAVKIDDVVFTVVVKPMGAQLWENGPYWAECNVGAMKPEECGYYFWWGDTVGYKRNANDDGWVSVKDESAFSFGSGNCPTYGKDNAQLQSEEYIDATGNLVAAHDAATAHLGAPWRMPTDAEFSALINNCVWEWTSRNGVSGRLVKGRGAYASKSIFLPAAGEVCGSYLYSIGGVGNYLSSTPISNSIYRFELFFNSSNFDMAGGYRYDGGPVRPVRGFIESSAETTHLTLDCRDGAHIDPPDGGPYEGAVDGDTWLYSFKLSHMSEAFGPVCSLKDGEVEVGPGGRETDKWAVSPAPTGAVAVPQDVDGYSVVALGCSAFEDSELTTVALHNTIRYIGGWCLSGCKKLESVSLPDSVVLVGDKAFDGCTKLKSVQLSRNLEYISWRAFDGCASLTSICLPGSLKAIGEDAFVDCDALTSVIFEGAPPVGVLAASIKQDAEIRYNMLYEEEWLPVIASGGWSNAKGYVPSLNDLAKIFGEDSGVAKNIKDETELIAFYGFLKDCSISSASDLTPPQKQYAYQSFKLSVITTAPQLFEEEPVLKIDDLELTGGNLSLTISLTAGAEAIHLAKDRLAEKIRVGTMLGDITGKPTIVASPAADGTSLTFTITPPEGNQGFVRVRID